MENESLGDHFLKLSDLDVPLLSAASRTNVKIIWEKMPDKSHLAQLHTVGAPHPSLVLLHMHSCTITQKSQFRDDSRIMQSSLISRLLWQLIG